MAKITKNTKTKLEIIALLLIIIGGLMAILLVQTVETYKFIDDATYFYIGQEFDIYKGDKAILNTETNKIEINTNDGNILEGNGIPAYLKNSDAIITLNDMMYVDVVDNQLFMFKLSNLTTLEKTPDNITIKITRNGESSYESRGFLYDGKDSYVFLNNTKLLVDDRLIVLSPLSFVVCKKESYVQIYDFDSKNIETIYLDEIKDICISDELNDYFSVYPEYDFLDYSHNRTLLQSNFEGFKLYK